MRHISLHPRNDLRVRLDAAKKGVAASTQEAPNPFSCVAMIDDQERGRRQAYKTPPLLPLTHRFYSLWRQPVFFHQPGSKVFSASRDQVLSSPFSQPCVALSSIGNAVLLATLIRAGLAVGAEIFAGLREGREWKVLMAISTFFRIHPLSIAVKHGITPEPCHADVLLEIANA